MSHDSVNEGIDYNTWLMDALTSGEQECDDIEDNRLLNAYVTRFNR